VDGRPDVQGGEDCDEKGEKSRHIGHRWRKYTGNRVYNPHPGAQSIE
jgi:hypothetical protein